MTWYGMSYQNEKYWQHPNIDSALDLVLQSPEIHVAVFTHPPDLISDAAAICWMQWKKSMTIVVAVATTVTPTTLNIFTNADWTDLLRIS